MDLWCWSSVSTGRMELFLSCFRHKPFSSLNSSAFLLPDAFFNSLYVFYVGFLYKMPSARHMQAYSTVVVLPYARVAEIFGISDGKGKTSSEKLVYSYPILNFMLTSNYRTVSIFFFRTNHRRRPRDHHAHADARGAFQMLRHPWLMRTPRWVM